MPTSEHISRGLRDSQQRAEDSLTPREMEAWKHYVGGKNAQQVAVLMGVTRESARQLKKAVRRKLGFRALF